MSVLPIPKTRITTDKEGIARQFAEASDKGTVVVDGRKLSLQVYREDLNHAVSLEEVVMGINDLQNKYRESLKLKSGDVCDSDVSFGLLHHVYRFVVCVASLVTALIVPHDIAEAAVKSNSDPSEMSNVFVLNTISLIKQTKLIFIRFISVYQDNPAIVNVYLTFIGVSTKFYLFFLLTMTASTLRGPSFILGVFFLVAGSALLILFMPLILLTISSIIMISLTISITNKVFIQSSKVINSYVPTRELLVYFADRIPPSVGRVEVSHQKQRRDYEEMLKNQKTLPNGSS